MDTSGFCQVGRYGTLSLLRRLTQDNNGNEDNIITSFGIDDEELTFGSSTTCGVRLYYPDVEALHCKIVFENYKAFLAVLGVSGVLVDGCKVYPHTSGGSSEQTIIPLSNMSEFEIHSKRFRFAYPPKEMRKALYATPARPPQKSLRLSMIHSAQVFSPRPSTDPRENLRLLQSPLKNPSRSPMKPRNPSPLKAGTILEEEEEDEDDDGEEEDIVLVHTNHPRVVEEEKDLVILEAVPVQLLSPSKSSTQFPILPSASSNSQGQPKTPPRRRSLGGNALHRAVLIRSAQRAVRIAEAEAEDEEEEMEVLGVLDGVVPDEGEGRGEGEDKSFDFEMDVDGEEGEAEEEGREREEDGDTDTDEEDDEEYKSKKNAQKSLWRKSIERILPWAKSDVNEEADTSNDTNETDETDERNDQDESMESTENDENEEPLALPVPAPQRSPAVPSAGAGTQTRKTFGPFMTPGPHHPNANTHDTTKANGLPVRRNLFPQATISEESQAPAVVAAPAPGPGRFSLGGGEARRVVVEQPWRVRDLVVPMPSMQHDDDARNTAEMVGGRGPTTPRKSGPTPIRPKLTPSVSEEERRAIQERRRSAVKMLGTGLEWVPGMSPAKSSGSSSSSHAGPTSVTTASEDGGRRSRSVSPVKQSAGTAFRPTFGSPTKGRPLAHAISEEDSFADRHAENTAANQSTDDEMDTRGLLERMKETVEGMKRRRSVVLGTPQGKTPGTVQSKYTMRLDSVTYHAEAEVLDERREEAAEVRDQPLGSMVKKLDFTKIGSGTPARSRSKSPLPPSTTKERGRSKSPLPGSQHLNRSRATTPPASQVGDDHEVQEKDKPFSLLRPGAMEERRQTLTFAAYADGESADGNGEVVPLVLPSVVVEDTEMGDAGGMDVDNEKDEDEKVITPETPKKSRSRKSVAQEQDQDDVEMNDEVLPTQQPTKPPSKTRSAAKVPASRQNSRTPQPVPEIEAEVEIEAEEPEEEPEPKIGPPRRGRKVAAVSVDEDKAKDEPQPEEPATKEPAKRGRKPRGIIDEAEVQEPEVEVEPTPAPAKRGRPRKVITPTEAGQGEGSSKPASRVKPPSKSITVAAAAKKPASKTRATAATMKAAATSRSKAGSGTKTPSTQEEDDEADPLDSYEEDDSDIPAPPPARSTPATTAAAKAKAKATTPATTTKKRGVAVKKEPEDEAPSKTPATRVGRSAKANAGSGRATPATGAASKVAKATPAATTTATKATRGRPKTPATAPAATTNGNAVAEKENQASGSGSGSGSGGSEEPGDEAGGAVKIRVSRSRGAATTAATKKTPATTGAARKVKTEEETDESAAPARTRATRVMRTRVKTGWIPSGSAGRSESRL